MWSRSGVVLLKLTFDKSSNKAKYFKNLPNKLFILNKSQIKGIFRKLLTSLKELNFSK